MTPADPIVPTGPAPEPHAAPGATPVTVAIADRNLSALVTRHVESVLGWQVVVDTPGLPAQVRIVDAAGAGPGAIVVLDGPDVDAVRRVMASGAADVLVWPADAPRLSSLRPRQAIRVPGAVVSVGGCAGGVGTTTCCVAIAAAAAWIGRATWLVTGADGWRMLGLDALADPVQACRALPNMHVAQTLRDLNGRTKTADVIVIDVATDPRRRVLIARPDRHLVDALSPSSLAAADALRPRMLLTVGHGGLRPAEVDRLADGLPHLHVDHDVRVARAGLRGWLPGRLPGRLIRDVADWLPAGRPWSGTATGVTR